jgi:hypothetical protein
MDFTKLVSFLKERLPVLPKPFSFLNRVISGEHPERASAFLAVASGVVLIIGFMFIVVAMTKFDKKLTTEFITVCGALVSLSTFNQVDKNVISPTTTVISSKISNPEDKETLQG